MHNLFTFDIIGSGFRWLYSEDAHSVIGRLHLSVVYHYERYDRFWIRVAPLSNTISVDHQPITVVTFVDQRNKPGFSQLQFVV